MGNVVKRSVSFPAEVFAAAEEEARLSGVSVSAVITAATEHHLVIRRGLAAVAEWEAENGPFTDEERAEAQRRLDNAH